MRCKCPWTHHRRFPSPSPSPYPDPPSPSPLSQLSVLPNCALLRFDSMCAKQDHYFLLNHTISYFFLLDCVKMKCTLSGSRRHGDFLACFLFVSACTPRRLSRGLCGSPGSVRTIEQLLASRTGRCQKPHRQLLWAAPHGHSYSPAAPPQPCPAWMFCPLERSRHSLRCLPSTRWCARRQFSQQV